MWTVFVCLGMQACKYAMRVCAPVVGSDQITAMFQNHLHEDKSLHYGEFINDLTKYLVRLSHTQIQTKHKASPVDFQRPESRRMFPLLTFQICYRALT